MRKFVSAAVAAFVMTGAAHATPVTLTFDTVSAGTVITNQFAGVTISATGGSGQAIVFDSNNPTGGDGDLGAPLTLVGPDEGFAADGNLLIVSEDGDLSDPDDAVGGTITFDFDEAVTFLGFNGVDFTDSGANLIVTLFGAAGEIFSFDFNAERSASVGDNLFYSFFDGVFGADGVAGVTSVVIQLTGSGAIDNFTFEPSAVPIPGALPLLLSGIAGLGFSMKKKRKA